MAKENGKTGRSSLQSCEVINEYKRKYNYPAFQYKERNQGKLFPTPEACRQYFMEYSN